MSSFSPSKTKVRRTAAQWQQIMDAYSVSDLPQAKFCRQHGVALSSFCKWRSKFESGPPLSVEPAFVELPLPVSSPAVAFRLELNLGDGMVLRVR